MLVLTDNRHLVKDGDLFDENGEEEREGEREGEREEEKEGREEGEGYTEEDTAGEKEETHSTFFPDDPLTQ